MDADGLRIQLQDKKTMLEQYLQHPVTLEVFKDIEESQQSLITTLCDVPIIDMESFFKHFEAIGHLRGLRQTKANIMTNLEDVVEQLRKLPNGS